MGVLALALAPPPPESTMMRALWYPDRQAVGAGFDGSGFGAGKEFPVKQGHALRGGVTCFLKVES